MKNKGITLIALVITIIVLLILAGISISMLAGDNSILQRAVDAKEATEEAEIQEKIQIAEFAAMINKNLEVDYDLLKDALSKELGTEGTDWTITPKSETPWEVTVKGKKYAISSSNKGKDEIPKVSDANPGVLEGTGTASDPYTVYSLEDLVAFAYNVNHSDNLYVGNTVKLACNLDVNSDNSYANPNTKYVLTDYGYKTDESGTAIKTLLTDSNGIGFVPIGNGQSDGFGGIFDGNNHSISNLYINTNSYGSYGGLFGKTSKSITISNIGIKDCNIRTKDIARWYYWSN